VRFEVPDLPWDDVGHRQGLRDRFDEAVGEDERIQEGSFGLDPGMRAADEFQDVTSAGYREAAKRVAERGGAEQYATSVGQEEGEAEADELRNVVALILAGLIGGGFGAGRGVAPGFAGRNQSGAAFNQGANFHGMTGTPLQPYRQFVGGSQGVTRIPSKEAYDRMSALRRGFRG
jgi:hypothetical protein